MTTDPTPDLCCTHGERIDRILDLMEDIHAARVGNCGPCEERKRKEAELLEQWKQEFMARHGLTDLAEGGLVKGDGPPIGGLGGVDCVIPKGRAEKLAPGGLIEPPEGHTLEPIVIDLRHEQVMQIRNDPKFRAVLDQLNRDCGTAEPDQE